MTKDPVEEKMEKIVNDIVCADNQCVELLKEIMDLSLIHPRMPDDSIRTVPLNDDISRMHKLDLDIQKNRLRRKRAFGRLKWYNIHYPEFRKEVPF